MLLWHFTSSRSCLHAAPSSRLRCPSASTPFCPIWRLYTRHPRESMMRIIQIARASAFGAGCMRAARLLDGFSIQIRCSDNRLFRLTASDPCLTHLSQPPLTVAHAHTRSLLEALPVKVIPSGALFKVNFSVKYNPFFDMFYRRSCKRNNFTDLVRVLC